MGWFLILIPVNNAAVNKRVQISLQNSNLNSSGIYSAVGILDHVAVVQILRKTLFIIRGCAILHSLSQHIREQISLHFHYHLSFLIAICYEALSHSDFFICVYLMISSDRHLFIHLLAMYIYSSVKCLLIYFAFIWVICFCFGATEL